MDNTATLLAGALDQLMRHSLTGCRQAAHQAARLLEVLSESPEMDQDTRRLCGRMSDSLAAGEGVGRAGATGVAHV